MPAKKIDKPKKKVAKKTVKAKKAMTIKEITALVKLAKSEGIKKLEVDGLLLEFADVIDTGKELEELNPRDFDDEGKDDVSQGIKEAVAIQDLKNREVKDDRTVTIEEDDLWSI